FIQQSQLNVSYLPHSLTVLENAAIILGEHEMRNQRATDILKGLSYNCSYYRKAAFSLTVVGICFLSQRTILIYQKEMSFIISM
ncbi:hypothetical protein, partial [Escherichia coli]|uniref:hypothetical protein n=2 Tax=Escherichia coli TaxID=562 RepID=UPI0009351DCD